MASKFLTSIEKDIQGRLNKQPITKFTQMSTINKNLADIEKNLVVEKEKDEIGEKLKEFNNLESKIARLKTVHEKS